MNSTQLQCFTTLANTLNYVRAAEELHMTQPAVTRRIQSLEQELGAKLFFRTTKNVSLTQISIYRRNDKTYNASSAVEDLIKKAPYSFYSELKR